MEKYTVKDIAEMLHTNPETVRRWIRNEKMHAVKDNKTGENIVSADELIEFLANTPKYSHFNDSLSISTGFSSGHSSSVNSTMSSKSESVGSTTSSMSKSVGTLASGVSLSALGLAGLGIASPILLPISLMSLGIAGGTAIKLIKQNMNKKDVSSDELKNLAICSMEETERKIKEKKDEIEELQAKLYKAQSELDEYNIEFEDLKALMTELNEKNPE
ncbi:MAG: helix-turn-helix domain-containing protein [Oscillospiraceae bacterium]|nr:helix-turn-helix domain-containing protein [Oscillospiraceae bacterium]